MRKQRPLGADGKASDLMQQNPTANPAEPENPSRPGNQPRRVETERDHAKRLRSLHLPASNSCAPEDTPVPLVLIHGLFSSPQEFGLINNSFRLAGIEAIVLEIDGYTDGHQHGMSQWRDWLRAASDALDAAVSPGRRIVLAGLCVGGVLAAALALEREAQTEGLALLSPTFDYDGWGQSRWRHLRHAAYALKLDRFIRVAEREPYGIKNERIRRWVIEELKVKRKSAVGPALLPLWAIHEAEKLMAHVRANTQRIDCRTLVMHAREDELSALPGVERIVQGFAATDKKLVVLENSYHMITIDNDRARVATELTRFVRGDTAAAGTL